ncbi:MAG TPA: thioredoxin domain-containing protein, partial [Terriglobales bacterium]|nr:thioredoxin domain-containing protein [Terriglobales bacterium]
DSKPAASPAQPQPATAQSQAPSAAQPAAPTKPATPPADNSPTALRLAENVRARFKVPVNVKIEISQPRPSELSGYDVVTVTLAEGDKRSPHDFYLSKDGNTLAQLSKMDVSKYPFDTAGRPSLGPADAKVTVIVYDDFQCPYCARGYKTLMHQVLPDYKDKIRIVYKDFPLSEIHPWAIHAAVDANCLFAQSTDAYWDFADYVHGNQGVIKGENRPLPDQFAALDKSAEEYGKKHNVDAAKLDACVKAQESSAVMASSRYGERALGIDATPTIFINGSRYDGAVPEDDLRAALNDALKNAGVTPPPSKSATSVVNDPNAVKDVLNKLGPAAKPGPQSNGNPAPAKPAADPVPPPKQN